MKGRKSAGAYSRVGERAGAVCRGLVLQGIGAEDYAKGDEFDEGGAKAGAWGLGAVVKNSVMRRWVLSGIGGGGTALGANVSLRSP